MSTPTKDLWGKIKFLPLYSITWMLFRLDRPTILRHCAPSPPPHCYNFDNLVMRPTVKLNVCLKTYTHAYTYVRVLSRKKLSTPVCPQFFDVFKNDHCSFPRMKLPMRRRFADRTWTFLLFCEEFYSRRYLILFNYKLRFLINRTLHTQCKIFRAQRLENKYKNIRRANDRAPTFLQEKHFSNDFSKRWNRTVRTSTDVGKIIPGL